MRIATYNFLAGGSAQRSGHWRALRKHIAPDVLLTQESKAPDARVFPYTCSLWTEAGMFQPVSAVTSARLTTLRWTGNRRAPYHCDGIFVPQSWSDRLKSCVVFSGRRWNRLSDHNPVVADFEMEKQ
jgi:exonuclease III